MKKLFLTLTLTATAFTSAPAVAGPFTDDFSRCLATKATAEDKLNLVRWIFTSLSQHPEIKQFSNVSPEQQDVANRDVAELYTSLLTERCAAELKAAVKYESPAALQTAFTVLGQVAAADLFAHPDVLAGMADVDKYMDQEKIEAVITAE